eukprot:TRINITY_DN2151_c0_g2_i2.p1 TRINITY_DN2151_c0_g2~~TRINITY_DN2151_c0_g2_i2.p1  ORF type:complete len:182 (-),score=20.33 TRINITY_DN2151_c0_g2_i2:430-975(-)
MEEGRWWGATSERMHWHVGSSMHLKWLQGLCSNEMLFSICCPYKARIKCSALRDKRFPPIQAREVPYLECTVSLLTDYEPANNYLDWEIGKHGLILEFTDYEGIRRSATYLPEIAAQEGWTKIETIDSLMRKSGYFGVITESLRKRVHLTRYQSTLYTMHYSDYVAYVKNTRGATPLIGSR